MNHSPEQSTPEQRNLPVKAEPSRTEGSPEKAVALTYDGSRAPFISASGDNEVAEMILRIAREHGVPIYENKDLVNILSRLEIGEEIPELLYRTIAEIIAFVYMLKGKTPEGFKHQQKAKAGTGDPLLLQRK